MARGKNKDKLDNYSGLMEYERRVRDIKRNSETTIIWDMLENINKALEITTFSTKKQLNDFLLCFWLYNIPRTDIYYYMWKDGQHFQINNDWTHLTHLPNY